MKVDLTEDDIRQALYWISDLGKHRLKKIMDSIPDLSHIPPEEQERIWNQIQQEKKNDPQGL